MSHARWIAVATSALVLILTGHASTSIQTLIPAGSLWKYNDGGVAPSGWTTVAFNDTAWPSGVAQLGYGDGDESTTLSYGGDASNKRITSYFRRAFTVSNPAAFTALAVRYVRDDGAVVYVNGIEVVRSNMPSGTVTSATLASAAIGGVDESAWTETPIPASVLQAGANIVAVEIHQQSPTSSDVSFDLELRATDAVAVPPTVTLVSPADGLVSNAAVVAFQASATSAVGLSSMTMSLAGPPVTTVFSGPSQVQDAQLTAGTPTLPNGGSLSINVDGLTPHAHALMKFPALIGGAAGQVPGGAIISSATLTLNCTNPGQAMQFYRLTQDWEEDQATWNERAPGVPWGAPGADGAASNTGVASVADCTATGARFADITRIVQDWADGAPNDGIVFTDSGTDGVDFDSSESATSPTLTVVYKSWQVLFGTQSVSGTSATVTIPVNIPPGTYFWNVRTTDTSGQASFAPADRQLILDPGVPDAPTLVSPGSGTTNVPTDTTLNALVSNPSGGALTATATLRKAAAPEFTIIALPDTQHYSEAFPEIFTAQTQWIVANKGLRNIVFVTHEGDVVEHQGTTLEWQRANTSMTLLDGVVPYGIGPGNHDLPTTNFNIYFPWARYVSQPWYGGHYQSLNDNNFQLFSAGGMDFVIVHMVFCPPAGAVAWADSIFKTYPNRIGIMTTHGYINESASRTVSGCSSTQYLWDGLAVPNPNLHFMLSGHVHDESRRTDVANGHAVYQMLADFQDRASGGEGWLRILRFVPADNKVYVQTYSPWLNRFESDANSEFQLDFPMAGQFNPIGSANVASGGTATFTPAGLLADTTYEWQVTATNAAGKTVTGPVWRFTTAPATPVNQPPTASGDAYAVQSGNTLTVAAPGVLSNDSDPDGTSLTAQLVTNVAHGTLSLAAGGGFTYMPTAGYTGPDSFTYRASDGQATSNTATVALSVTAPPAPATIFTANFNAGQDSFTYLDDTFKGTAQPSSVSGSRIASGGFTGGALRVLIGGLNGNDITNMSGGWRRTFTLSAALGVTLSFRYRMDQTAEYESDELSQVLATIDSTLVPATPGYVQQISGNGNGGAVITTGWKLVQYSLGPLPAGSHTVTLGGFNNKKTDANEQTTILIDDVTMTSP